MVLITSNNTDKSSNLMIDWLISYRQNFLRLNTNDTLKISFRKGETYIEYSYYSFKINDIKGIFTRGVWFNFDLTLLKQDYFINEYNQIIDNLIFCLNKRSNFFLNPVNINKLIVSNIAKDIGLKVPDEIIVETKTDLENLIIQNLKLCTKSLSGVCTMKLKNGYKSLYTIKLNESHLDNVKLNKFYPSLIQKYIDKLFEVRSFVLNDRIFSMAIFSQKQTDANHDYRKGYSNVRTSVIKLPKEIEIKILKLLNELKLRSGSIDLIYSKSKEFYFLEVNPSGQFNFLSEACNYNIENEIVKLFLN